MRSFSRRARRFAAPLLAAVVFATAARADDLADEADLQFRLGAARYQAKDYLGALEHLLASNRLAPNRNVRFNVARCYEQLGQYPEAYRSYVLALEGESDPAARTRVEDALGKILPRVAVLRVGTNPPGATIYLDRRDLGTRGQSPRTLGVAPGRYRIIAELTGYEPAESPPITAEAGKERRVELTLKPRVETLVGNLVIESDVPNALVEVDGKARGFTPAVVSVSAANEHSVRLTLRGFEPHVQRFNVGANEERKIAVTLTPSDEIIAASRVAESLADAPSSVSIVPAQELRAMGYPTIAEALRGMRGVYVSDDRSYATLGFRGLGRLGSYGNRVLVTLDGHPLNDDWIGSSYVGYDARTDLEDIERIEVVRGPGSVLYGTNAFSGVINVVTRKEAGPSSAEAGVATADYGVQRARARGNVRFGPDAGMWLSVAGAHSAGRDFASMEVADSPPPGVLGTSRNVDGFDAGTINGRIWWKSLSAMWFLHTRTKHIPTGQYEALLGDPRTIQTDTRATFEARFEPQVSKSVQLLTRAHVNHYAYDGVLPRAPEDAGVEVDRFRGTWVGLEQRAIVTPTRALRFTAGGELQAHLKVHQTVHDDAGQNLDDSRPYQTYAGYLLADLAPSQNFRISAGSRLDVFSTFGYSNNPRLALIMRPYAGGNLKVMAGKAFRAPSVYELYYNDGGQTQGQSPDLLPEAMYSGEVEFSHRFSRSVTGTITTFGNYAQNLIVQAEGATADGLLHYVNLGSPVFTFGEEAELRRDWRQGWMLSASYSLQSSRYLAGTGASDLLELRPDATKRNVANAPNQLASLRGAAPIIGRALVLATRVSFEGPRWDRHENVGDPAQERTDASVIWDFVLSGEEQRWHLRYSLGIYNLIDTRYTVPVSAEFSQRTILQNGRTLFASANLTF